MTKTETDPVLLEEHRALRDEILLRIRQQHELLALAWIAFGVLTALAVWLGAPSLSALYVLLATAVAASWQHNGARTVQLKTYLRDELEPRLFGEAGGWERFLARSRVVGPFGSCWLLSTKGFLVATQTLSTLLAATLGPGPPPRLAVGLAVLAQVLTLALLRYPRLARRDA